MKALILAGGKGSRLWPKSRRELPKQFLSLDRSESLLQKTAQRLLTFLQPKDLFVVSGESNQQEVVAQLSTIDPALDRQVISEPCGKNTAPAIALGIAFLQEHCNHALDELIFVCPSDHLIMDDGAFVQSIRDASAIASQGYIVTFGVPPDRPETGYGYIH